MAGYVEKAAPLTAIHAVMVERVAGDVVTSDVLEDPAVARLAQTVFEHAATKRIEYREGFALRVEAGAARIAPLRPIICNGQTGAAERIEMRDRGSGFVGFGLLGGSLLGVTECTTDPLVVPRCPVVGIAAKKSRKTFADVAVFARVGDQDRVVDVPALLSPRVEDNFLPGVVRMQRRDDPVSR